MLDRDPFPMAGRFFQLSARPVLGPNRLRDENNQDQGNAFHEFSLSETSETPTETAPVVVPIDER